MCTLLVGVERPRAGRLLLGANRDEVVSRPSLPPHVVVRDPRIVAGRDRQAGGTWLGLSEGRLVAAILNRPTSGDRPADAPGPPTPWEAGATPDRSRGLLCLDALRMFSAREALAWLADEVLTCRYAPFTLFLADEHGAHAAYWTGELRSQELRPGWHVLGHGDADDPLDPRASMALTRLLQSPPRRAEDLAPILQSHDGGRAICLHAEGHGTVSSSLLEIVWASPRETRYLHSSDKPCLTPYQDFSGLVTGERA